MSQRTSPFAPYAAVASSSGTGSPRTPPPVGGGAGAGAPGPPSAAAASPSIPPPSTRAGAATTIGGTTFGSLSILSTVDVGDIRRLSRMSSFNTVARYTKPTSGPAGGRVAVAWLLKRAAGGAPWSLF
jgi:hypothetical protein